MSEETTSAETLHAALTAARTSANASRGDTGTKREERDDALEALRMRLRGLLSELRQLLSGDDARWRTFGFNPPNAVGLPDVPEGLELQAAGAGHLLARWEGSAFADRYHVYRKIVGVDDDYVLTRTVTETEADLNTFTTGQLVAVRISAANDAGESLLGEPVEKVAP